MDAGDAGDAQSVVALRRRDVEVVAAPKVLRCAVAAVGVAEVRRHPIRLPIKCK